MNPFRRLFPKRPEAARPIDPYGRRAAALPCLARSVEEVEAYAAAYAEEGEVRALVARLIACPEARKAFDQARSAVSARTRLRQARAVVAAEGLSLRAVRELGEAFPHVLQRATETPASTASRRRPVEDRGQQADAPPGPGQDGISSAETHRDPRPSNG